MKKFFAGLALGALALMLVVGGAWARDNLSLTFDLAALDRQETKDMRLAWTGGEFRMEALRENLLWFQYFSLPKNAAFRNNFSLEAEVSSVQDRGVAGIALGNRRIDLVFYVYLHDRHGYARIATADSSQAHFISEKTFSYPSTPFTLGVVYDVDGGVFTGYVNGQSVLSISSTSYPRLTQISSVNSVALVGGSRHDQPSGVVGFRSFSLEAE